VVPVAGGFGPARRPRDGRQSFVADPARAGSADVLSVDLYDHEAASPVLDSAEFYRHCHALLGAGGVMTVNLFGRDASFETSTGASPRPSVVTPC
jgi:spermidine synthase